MRYYANFWANNNTRFLNKITDTSKWRILKTVRDTARAERYAGNNATFWVEDASGEEVFSGIISANGVLTYLTFNYKPTYLR